MPTYRLALFLFSLQKTPAATLDLRRSLLRIVAAASALVMLGSLVLACRKSSADFAWNTNSRTIRYKFTPGSLSAPNQTAELIFAGDGTATLRINTGQGFHVRFGKDGVLAVLPAGSGPPPVVPVYTDLFQVGPSAGKTLRVGETYAVHVPPDGVIPDTQLTVQTRLRVTLKEIRGDVGTLDFEADYRVISNKALVDFKADILASSASGASGNLIKALEDAGPFRLAGAGSVHFNVAAGQLESAQFTGAGMPLKSFARDELSRQPETFTYKLERVN